MVTVLGHPLDDVITENRHELPHVDASSARGVRHSEVVSLETDPVGVGAHQVRTSEESVVRILLMVATVAFGHH